jgi:glycosyltransferase involved in cell wall biosynthesis
LERDKKQPSSMPRYTIVIPTRNRVEYLSFAIESVLSNRRDDIELVVSDNYSVDGTAEYLQGLSDGRLKVVRPPTEIPMTAHYEYALSQASGEWVSILGDDDAVMPYIFERLDGITGGNSSVDIISSERSYYFWPGCEDLYGSTVVSYRRGSKKRLRSTRGDLFLALAGLRSCFDLPQIYTTCIVKRALVEQIRNASNNRFYYSIIPDMYSVIALSLTAHTYLRLDEPLFWTGTSNKSLGRSDRIYKDTELLGSSSNRTGMQALKLHEDISQNLHSLGFSSLYLYEAILQCPLSRGAWKGHFVAAVVYASLKVSAGEVSISRAVDRSRLIDQIGMEIKKNNVPLVYVSFFILVIRVFSTLRWALRLVVRLQVKIGDQFHANTIFSTSREAFPNILAASKAVERLN